VAKPPELAPFGMLRFAELALVAGLPAEVLNVVVGGPATGAALAAHPGIDKLTFTGGTGTARAVMAAAAESLTPLVLELGGKSPNIIVADDDLDVAATLAARSGTALLSGQGCALPTRTYVHEDVYDEVAERILSVLASLQVGDPLDPLTVVGPVVTEEAMERILGVIAKAKTDGATLVVGGERLGGGLADGWSAAPAVFGDVDQASSLAQEEVLGPVQALMRFSTEAEVLAKANDTPYGLAAYVHSAHSDRLERMVHGINAGVVVTNGFGNLSPMTPFGGMKQSGFGRGGGTAGIEETLHFEMVLSDR